MKACSAMSKTGRIRISTPILEILEKRGLLPSHCHRVELHIPPRDAMVLRYEVFLTNEDLRVLAEAFQLGGEDIPPKEPSRDG
jgi:hypothetical protein